MAKSPSHKLGQLIGDYFEQSIERFLVPLFEDGRYYLDYKHPRKSRNNKKLVEWQDSKGHKHNLDYVIEKDGTEHELGKLVSIIEIAWRTGGRHSANKVQEIMAAVNPIADKYRGNNVYKAAILSGDFTGPPLQNLEANDFDVVYFDKGSIKSAFASQGIDILISDGDDDNKTQRQVDIFESLTAVQRDVLAEDLYRCMSDKMAAFTSKLMSHLDSPITEIIIATSFSKSHSFDDINNAITSLEQTEPTVDGIQFSKYVIIIRYKTGTKVEIDAVSRDEAIQYLRRFM